MSDNCPDDIELHRPYIDAVTIKCPECGKEMHRVPEVIDCWFDSGAMPFAQHHYPFENKEVFEQQFPAQFISEAVDQTRGWFYSLLAISTLIFNKAPYENVIVLGHVQDENGQKMSKSKGNAVDPFDALETYGADAIRWYFYCNSAPWLPNRFHGKAVVEGQRKFMGTLWNTYAFFVLYANIDQFDATKYTLEYDKLSVMDKWLLSKLNTLVLTVDKCLADYKIPETARALQDFVDDMSNWYVRRSRERFWAKGMEQDKINAYMTLYTALVTVAKAAAPMIPFMTGDIYRNLVCSIDASAPESVHLCDFPEVNEAWIDKELEENMAHLLDIVVMGRACRNTANIKNRQPIGQMFVKAPFTLSQYYDDIILDELNVKKLTFTDDVRDFTSYNFKPQLKTVGDPALGNGGLGRLAACFLDSLATLGYCAYGCGIRYRFGMFKQKIENGYQVEVPDNWLKNGYPFELRRPEYAKNLARNIVEVLYPNDNHYAGKELRLKQQYFFISASIQAAVAKYKKKYGDLHKLHEKVAFQLNDTHPTVTVPELMRILMDENGFEWDEAWEVTMKTCAYTNHTIMAEALEKWPIELFSRLLPRIYQIVEEINRRFLIEIEQKYPGDQRKKDSMAIVHDGQVRMANLAIVGGHAVNGVAQLHTEILKKDVLKDFYQMMPEKFNNKTNGITQRRFLFSRKSASG